jgi:hypothetical protein
MVTSRHFVYNILATEDNTNHYFLCIIFTGAGSVFERTFSCTLSEFKTLEGCSQTIEVWSMSMKVLSRLSPRSSSVKLKQEKTSLSLS